MERKKHEKGRPIRRPGESVRSAEIRGGLRPKPKPKPKPGQGIRGIVHSRNRPKRGICPRCRSDAIAVLKEEREPDEVTLYCVCAGCGIDYAETWIMQLFRQTWTDEKAREIIVQRKIFE